MFPLLSEILIATDVNQELIFNVISQHLKVLTENFNNYFPEDEDPSRDISGLIIPF